MRRRFDARRLFGKLADVLLDDQIAGAADQDQMLDIIAPDQYEPPPIIDGRSVGDRQAHLPVAPAGNECSTRYPPQDREDDKKEHNHQKEQKNKSHNRGSGFANNSGQPSVHHELLLCDLRARNVFPDMGFEALLCVTLVRANVSRNPDDGMLNDHMRGSGQY
jgi:hypothetical protein